MFSSEPFPTAHNVRDWERELLADVDPENLADLMKLSSTLDRAATAFLNPPLALQRSPAQQKDVGWSQHIDALRVRAIRDGSDEKYLIASLIRMYSILVAAMQSTPTEPSDAEIIWRYVTGDIGASTACLLSGWGEAELIRHCIHHGFEQFSEG